MQKFKGLLENKNIIKAMLIGYLAAFVFVLFAFTIKSVPTENADERAAEESVSREGFTYSRPQSSLKKISAADDEEEFVPAPDKLNLAYFFPDGADTSDSINSYAGKIYTSLNSENASYFASYFDLTDSTPRSVAASYGLGADRVMGKYNPNDAAHSEADPSTWTVNSFRNINVSFYDGDGNRISGYYNAQEIMSLASVYAYYHEMDDYEAMQEYCEQLFNASVTAKVSLGSVYYDSGCLNRTVEQEASEAIALEKAQSQLEGGSGVSVGTDSQENGSEYATVRVSDESSYTHDYAVANRDLSYTRTAASNEGSTSLNQYSEQSSAVIYDYTTAAAGGSSNASGSSSGKKNWKNISENVVVSPGTAQTEATTEAPAEPESTTLSPAEEESAAVVVGLNKVNTGFDLSGLSLTAYAKRALNEETLAPVLVADAASRLYDNVVVSPAENASGAADTSAAGAQTDGQELAGNGASDTASGSSDMSAAGTGAAAASGTQASNGAGTAAEAGTQSAAVGLGAQSAADISSDGNLSTAQDTAQTGSSTESGAQSENANGMLNDTEGTDTETVTVTSSYCPGHIDLYVSITIDGIEGNNNMFKIDPIGNNSDNFNEEWQGWTEDKIALAKTLCEQDWLENYGLSISSIKVAASLSSEEINNYLNSLSPEVSQLRRNIVEYALNSVGKIPYYWGGKPSGPGYTNNNFCTLISPDYRGRILRGLDCSGWINWVYWSVTGHSLAGESTGTLIGCGRRIQRSELQPGDIIIRTGSDAHVVMFLCWAQNGNFIGIHETGGVINNVVVSEMTASWPYYRALAD